ncbi:MAG: hypothetical protein P1P81_05765 [Desulfobulbales bacterium]|nr:hypothetical protein [Desulfobulbales bacterium]
MSENKERFVAIHTKAVWLAAWIVMLVIMAMILRNCVTSVIYGSKTDNAEVAYYYRQGEITGKAGLRAWPTDLDLANPVLRKAYSKGYRDGLDGYGGRVRSGE